MRRLSVTLLLVALVVSIPVALAQDHSSQAIRYCKQMAQQMNVLVDYTTTECFPSTGKGGYSFIFVSSLPVFSSEKAKKAWLIGVVGIFGHTFNSNSVSSDEVIVSDAKLMGSRQAYRIPAAMARDLQRQVKSGAMDLETMYSKILAAMQLFIIPQR